MVITLFLILKTGTQNWTPYLLGWFLVIKVLDWFKVTTYGAAASDGGCSFFCLENALECKMLKLQAA